MSKKSRQMDNINFIKELVDSNLENSKETVDIIKFMEAPWGASFEPRPAQKFILKSFYGYELDNTERYVEVPNDTNEKILFKFTEKEFSNYLFNEGLCNTNEITGKSFKELVLVVGRRGGKSVTAGVIIAYEIYKLIKKHNPLEYYNFPPHEKIKIINCASSDKAAGVIFGQATTLATTCSFTKDRVLNPTLDSFKILTDFDMQRDDSKKQATIEVMSGGAAAGGLRGQNAILVVIDEGAFFIQNGGRFSDEEVYKALTPSVTSFGADGKILFMSSAGGKYGKFYERYQQSFEEPDRTLMFQMHSAMLNPEIPESELKNEKKKNRVTFYGEYGAQFSDTVSAFIDDPMDFEKCINDKITLKTRGFIENDYFLGMDLGLKDDGTGIAIVHRDRDTNKIVLDYASLYYAKGTDVWDKSDSIYKNCDKYKNKEKLETSDICEEIEYLSKWFPLKSGFFDHYNGLILEEILHKMNLKQLRTEQLTATLKNDIFEVFKSLYIDELFEMPNDEMIKSELLSLQMEENNKKIKVFNPKRPGAHDDISHAIAIAVYECYNNTSMKKLTPVNKQKVNSDIAMTYKGFHLKKFRQHGQNPRVNLNRNKYR